MGDERRINQLTAKAYSDIGSSDYFAVDNASEAESKKLPASAIKNGINDASTTANTASTNATRALNIARSTSSFPTGDAYSSSSAYKVGDLVIYNNTLYRCKTACSAASWSVNSSNFESISLASAITDLNNDLTKHIIGSRISINDYNSSNNKYPCPSDGYITLVGVAGKNMLSLVAENGNNILNTNFVSSSANQVNSIFVKKDSKYYLVGDTTNNYAYFEPLK